MTSGVTYGEKRVEMSFLSPFPLSERMWLGRSDTTTVSTIHSVGFPYPLEPSNPQHWRSGENFEKKVTGRNYEIPLRFKGDFSETFTRDALTQEGEKVVTYTGTFSSDGNKEVKTVKRESTH